MSATCRQLGSIATFLILCFSVGACEEDAPTQAPDPVELGTDFLPLTTGSWWLYEAGLRKERREVLGPALLDGRETTLVRAVVSSDTTFYYYSYDPVGKIYLHGTDTRGQNSDGSTRRHFVITDPELLIFDATAEDGAGWLLRYTTRKWENGAFVPWGDWVAEQSVSMGAWKTVMTPAGEFKARESVTAQWEPAPTGYFYHRYFTPGIGQVHLYTAGHGVSHQSLSDYEIRPEE